MNYSDFITFLRGCFWVLFFIAPLAWAGAGAINAANDDQDSAATCFFAALVFQAAFMLTIGHSWVR